MDKDGKSGLMLAARCGHAQCVVDLHRHGALLDRVDSDGQSALFLAASNYHITCVKTLLRLGCQLKYKDNRNVNVVDIIHADKELLEVLMAAGCAVDHNALEAMTEVSSLLDLCRLQIRKSILASYDCTKKPNLFTSVYKLPLPGRLKLYIVYNVFL